MSMILRWRCSEWHVSETVSDANRSGLYACARHADGREPEVIGDSVKHHVGAIPLPARIDSVSDLRPCTVQMHV
ncbi:hypothetical protein KCU85_g183, partial [Aureobasidium melanogenum]